MQSCRSFRQPESAQKTCEPVRSRADSQPRACLHTGARPWPCQRESERESMSEEQARASKRASEQARMRMPARCAGGPASAAVLAFASMSLPFSCKNPHGASRTGHDTITHHRPQTLLGSKDSTRKSRSCWNSPSSLAPWASLPGSERPSASPAPAEATGPVERSDFAARKFVLFVVHGLLLYTS